MRVWAVGPTFYYAYLGRICSWWRATPIGWSLAYDNILFNQCRSMTTVLLPKHFQRLKPQCSKPRLQHFESSCPSMTTHAGQTFHPSPFSALRQLPPLSRLGPKMIRL